MTQAIQVSYPSSLAYSLKMQEQEFSQEMRKLAIVKLYEMGKISSSLAAKILEISRVDFLFMLSQYQVSFFQFASFSELLQDIENA